VNVTFSAASGGQGQLSIIPTGADGIARLNRAWVLNSTPGVNYYYANVANTPQIVFTANGT
jgi:hypothetical protein